MPSCWQGFVVLHSSISGKKGFMELFIIQYFCQYRPKDSIYNARIESVPFPQFLPVYPGGQVQR